MRLIQTMELRPVRGELPEVSLPLEVRLGDGHTATMTALDTQAWAVRIESVIDPAALTREGNTGFYVLQPDGRREEQPAIRISRVGNVLATDLSTALTFLTDVPLQVSRSFEDDRLIPENEEDRAALEALGTRRIHRDLRARQTVRTFNPVVDAAAVEALISRTEGLRLYADAIALPTDVGKYRELWRVLESAFALQGQPLVQTLSEYAPAQELGFDQAELDALHVIRGRISHANTRVGLEELLRAGTLASEKVDRLKCLAERVLLTKETWNSRGLGVNELTPARSWVGADGKVTIRIAGSG